METHAQRGRGRKKSPYAAVVGCDVMHGLSFFEVEVQGEHIMVGVADMSFDPKRCDAAYKSRLGWCLNLSTGQYWHNNRCVGRAGVKCFSVREEETQIIRVVIDDEDRSVSFWLNGEELPGKMALTDRAQELVPVVELGEGTWAKLMASEHDTGQPPTSELPEVPHTWFGDTNANHRFQNVNGERNLD
jgi:hypothetical protein